MPLDPNNQNYFALGEQPIVVLPWWKVRKNHIRVVAVFGIAVGLGLVGYYGYQTYTLTHVDVAKVEQAQNIIANAVVSCAAEEDPEACEAKATAGAARTTGQPTVCKDLSDKALMNCVTLIALDNADPSVCVMLSGDDEITCTDASTLRAANKRNDYGLCADIVNSEKRAACQAQLVDVVIAANECAKYEIDEVTCGYPAKLDAVVASGSPAGCAQFSDSQKSGCEDMFTSLDQDNDGLSLLAEYKLGTSDTNADTDGDGYTDSQEVASGHDPLK